MKRLTAKEAMQRVVERYNRKCDSKKKATFLGIDISDFLTVFLESTDVVLLEYFVVPGMDLEHVLMEHQTEIITETKNAKNVMLQIFNGRNANLKMDDMNGLNAIVNKLDENVNFYWGIEKEDDVDYRHRIEIYIAK